MMKFRAVAERQTTDLSLSEIFKVRDVFNVPGKTERRTWEFEADNEQEVRALFKQAADHPNVRGFDLVRVEPIPPKEG